MGQFEKIIEFKVLEDLPLSVVRGRPEKFYTKDETLKQWRDFVLTVTGQARCYYTQEQQEQILETTAFKVMRENVRLSDYVLKEKLRYADKYMVEYKRMVDRLISKYGPDISWNEILKEEEEKQGKKSQAGNNGSSGKDGNPEQGKRSSKSEGNEDSDQVSNSKGDEDKEKSSDSEVEEKGKKSSEQGTIGSQPSDEALDQTFEYPDVKANVPLDDLVSSGDVAKMSKAIADLFGVYDLEAQGEYSHRISGKKLVKELVSKRYKLNAARKEEQTKVPPAVLFLVDTSGSCSKVAKPTLAAAVGYTKYNKNSICIENFNGEPKIIRGVNVELRDLYFTEKEHADPHGRQYYLNLIKRKKIEVVVAFGDCEAYYTYKGIASEIPLIWLDSSRTSEASLVNLSYTKKELVNLIAYYQGVDDIENTTKALMLIKKKNK